MSKTFRLIPICLFLLLTATAFSQGEIDEQPKIMLRNEVSGAALLTSNGIGAGYRFGKRINARNQTLYDIEFMSVKHPKEIRLTSNYNYYSSRSFVFGKENAFFELKGFIGKQYEMYRKNDKGGLSIRYFYGLGPTIGILKPIYYEIRYISGDFYTIKDEKFNTATHQSSINGKSSFFKGFDELSVIPGATAKAGFSFEYSREDAIIHAIEVGMGIDAFPKAIPIMATQNNNFYFLNLTVGYRFGKVIDVSEAALARRDRDRIKDQKQNRKSKKEAEKAREDQLENF